MVHAECLALQAVPSTALRFAPGCAPTPLLLGTLEALLRAQRPEPELLPIVAAFVHAAATFVRQAGTAAATSCVTVDHQDVATCSSSGSSGGGSSSCGGGGGSGGGGSARGGGSSGDKSNGPCGKEQPAGSHIANSSSSSSSGHQEKDSLLLLDALASLAVTLRQALQPIQQMIAAQGSVLADWVRLEACVEGVLPCCSLATCGLLHLAAQQLAAPGAPSAAAVSSSAAAGDSVC
jgi:hypothetical protein